MSATAETLASYLRNTLIPNHQSVTQAFTSNGEFDQEAFNYLSERLQENRPITFNELAGYDFEQKNNNLVKAVSKLLKLEDVVDKINDAQSLTEDQIKLLRAYVRSETNFRQLDEPIKNIIKHLPISVDELELSEDQIESLNEYLGKGENDRSFDYEQLNKLNEDLSKEEKFLQAFQDENGDLSQNFEKGLNDLFERSNIYISDLEAHMGLREHEKLAILLGAEDGFKKNRQLTENEKQNLKTLWETHQKLDPLGLTQNQKRNINLSVSRRTNDIQNFLLREYSAQLEKARIQEHGIPETHVDTLKEQIELREKFEKFKEENNIDPIVELDELLKNPKENTEKLQLLGINPKNPGLIEHIQRLIKQYQSIQELLPNKTKQLNKLEGALEKRDKTLTPEEAQNYGIKDPGKLNDALTEWQNETKSPEKYNYYNPIIKEVSKLLEIMRELIKQNEQQPQEHGKQGQQTSQEYGEQGQQTSQEHGEQGQQTSQEHGEQGQQTSQEYGEQGQQTSQEYGEQGQQTPQEHGEQEQQTPQEHGEQEQQQVPAEHELSHQMANRNVLKKKPAPQSLFHRLAVEYRKRGQNRAIRNLERKKAKAQKTSEYINRRNQQREILDILDNLVNSERKNVIVNTKSYIDNNIKVSDKKENHPRGLSRLKDKIGNYFYNKRNYKGDLRDFAVYLNQFDSTQIENILSYVNKEVYNTKVLNDQSQKQAARTH